MVDAPGRFESAVDDAYDRAFGGGTPPQIEEAIKPSAGLPLGASNEERIQRALNSSAAALGAVRAIARMLDEQEERA